MSTPGYVYILASKRNGTLYVGVTSTLVQRVWQRRDSVVESFTSRYRIQRLVYFEVYADVSDAILREKRLKKWKREWKLDLIERSNPQWRDLYDEISRP